MAIQDFLVFFIEIFLIFMMIEKWKQGDFEVGEFVLFQSILIILIRQVKEFGRSIQGIFVNIADSSEMAEIIDKADIEKDLETSNHHLITKGKIEFKNIDFAYDTKNIFTNFNLKIKQGEHVALVGHSGAGKTSLINLLFRFFEFQKGEILFDDIKSSDFTYKSLRSQISLVPQNPEMFHRTIRDNISLGQNISDNQIWEALKKSQGYEFVKNLEKGLDTKVGEKGVKLSGGEKQRISIARSFCDNSNIIILDEATSALDSITESKLQSLNYKKVFLILLKIKLL
jgi:ATP-binding cassette subfamily B protein